ncbi:hypothetical protein CRUP_002769, partial [Coryphaenoides rupestris]
QSAEDIRKVYSEFCSRHPKAVKLYKELLARDKRFQLFIRECILLVTQRITKYPVLIQRILDNTKGNEEEVQSLSTALRQLKDLITAVDQEVLELERTERLQEIQARLDPRAQTEVSGRGGVFRGGELLRRRLVHDGTLLWKIQGQRMKDLQVLLMSDILVFLQDKDQKFIFPTQDKPSVVSLNNLIVRNIANQERGMFVISNSTPPEMCPSREEFPLIETEDKALLRRLRADIQQKDREVLELLQERVTLFSDLAELTRPGEKSPTPSNTRNLFRLDTPHAPLAEKRLADAISEVNGSYEFNTHMSQDTNGNRFEDEGFSEAAVICQDSVMELCLPGGPASSLSAGAAPPRFARSVSRDTGLDASVDAALLRRQLVLLQEEVNRLKPMEALLAESEKARAQAEKQLKDTPPKGHRRNRGKNHGNKG